MNSDDIYQILLEGATARLKVAIKAPMDSIEGAEVLALVELVAIYWMREF